jgi:hypothetical protein
LLAQVRQEIRIPDILGYMTLKCDLHAHAVFCDGSVWATARVDEAWREGLDAISITDHMKYQPHKHSIPTNSNRSYEIALPRAGERDILLIKGPRSPALPPGAMALVKTKVADVVMPAELKYVVRNLLVGPNEGRPVTLTIPGRLLIEVEVQVEEIRD